MYISEEKKTLGLLLPNPQRAPADDPRGNGEYGGDAQGPCNSGATAHVGRREQVIHQFEACRIGSTLLNTITENADLRTC